MRLKLFTCDHKRSDFVYTASQSIFATMVSNLPVERGDPVISDLSGENIAGDNAYSEIRHQFFVWKNMMPQYDYVGFEHYRRNFVLNPYHAVELAQRRPHLFDAYRNAVLAVDHVDTVVSPEVFSEHQNLRQHMPADRQLMLAQMIASYDIITARPFVWSLKEYWRIHFPNWSYDILVEAMNQTSYFRNEKSYVGDDLNFMYSKNMYIMKTEFFSEYMTFLFECFAFIATKEAIVPRMLGYYAEVLFSFWILQKRVENPGLRVAQLPIFVMH